MKIAVIETGGKQYLVSEGKTIQVEKLPHEAGKSFEFDSVLMVADGDDFKVGSPKLDAKVKAEVVAQKRLDKVTTRKYHSKTRFRKKKGHRQPVTMVKILEIK